MSRSRTDAGVLEAALEVGGQVARISASTPTEALAQLVEAAPLPDGVDRNQLLERLLEREELSSTGIGDGIALPHPHASDWHLAQPLIVLGMLDREIDWSAFDAKPVDTIFLLLASSDKEHLELLGGLARAIADPGLRELLRHKASIGGILKRIAEIEKG